MNLSETLSSEAAPSEATRRDASLLGRSLGVLTRWVLKFHRATILVAVGLAVAAIVVTSLQLELHTSRLHLLNPKSGFNKLWLQYIDEFGDQDDVVIVVEGEDPDQVTEAMDQIAAQLAREWDSYGDVLHRIDMSRLRSKGLYQLDAQQLVAVSRTLDRFDSVLRGDWSSLQLSNQLAGLMARVSDTVRASDMPRRTAAVLETQILIENLHASLDNGNLGNGAGGPNRWPNLSAVVTQLDELKSEYLLIGGGRIGLVLLRLVNQQESFTFGGKAISDLRELLGRIDTRHPDVTIGLTGLPIMENDEMVASQRASWQACLLSLIGVACLFTVGFGSLRHPLLATIALMLAVAWSFGYVTLTIGHLNILSMAFGVILIGLGIDFGIHYVARYLEVRRSTDDCQEALAQTATIVGPGILSGGLTTALAFFAAGLTDFTGVAELGIIAGGGILLCVLAAVGVLPAMILLLDRRRSTHALPRPIEVGRYLAPLSAMPRLVLTASVMVTAALALGIPHVWYDHNLLNLQQPDLESVDLERRLMAESDESVWFALSIAESRDELLARQAKFNQLTETVDHTEEIVSLMPADAGSKKPLIVQIAQRLGSLPTQPAVLPVDEPARLEMLLVELQTLFGSEPQNRPLVEQISQVRHTLVSLPAAEVYARIARFQEQTAIALHTNLLRLRSMAAVEPPNWSDLPAGLVTRFVGRNGHHLLKIYSKANVWEMDALERFVHDVRRVDPNATGKPLQTYEASRQMQRSYIHAACYALIAVCIVLVLDFGSLRHVMLALVPVTLGILQLFGILGLVGIPLNPANMIVLPLILGIGIDDGVHVIHDYRRQTGRFRLTGSTATAIFMTSLTTMIGFGSLMIANHRGLYSLGRVLTIGVASCLITSLVTLPALLQWLSIRRRDE